MSRDRMEGDEPRVILVTGDDHRGLRDAVGQILSRGRVSLVAAHSLAPEVDEIVRRAGSDVIASRLVLHADPDPPPDPWVAPTYRATYPTPGRSEWRKRTRRANSHGQRRS